MRWAKFLGKTLGNIGQKMPLPTQLLSELRALRQLLRIPYERELWDEAISSTLTELPWLLLLLLPTLAMLGPWVTLTILLVGALWRLKTKWTDRRDELLAQYGHQIEDLYEWSQYPDDPEVIARVRRHEYWLYRSGNQLKAKAVAIIFRDHEHAAEDWEHPEQWPLRLAKTIAENRQSRYTWLVQQYGQPWFLMNVKRQDGVTLNDRLTHRHGVTVNGANVGGV